MISAEDRSSSPHMPGGANMAPRGDPPGGTTTTTTTTATQSQSAAAAAASSVAKCVCGWKNCRAYQKAFRDARHEIWDGVIKLKFATDHPESMALKASIDRNLKVPADRANDWKAGKRADQQVCRYTVARHHWTEKHVQKYLADPKNYSFLKPFSIHGAKKYLHAVDHNETVGGSPNAPQQQQHEVLYLQCPNVPKEVVKSEFLKVKEAIDAKAAKSQPPSSSSKPSNNNASSSRPSSRMDHSHHSTSRANSSSDHEDLLVRASSANPAHSSSSARVVQDPATIVALKEKEDENKQLKDQLESMKSQLTFLHDMVRRLQEEHFDHVSVRSRTSRASRAAYNNNNSTTSHSNRRTQMANSSRSNRSGVPHEIELAEQEEVSNHVHGAGYRPTPATAPGGGMAGMGAGSGGPAAVAATAVRGGARGGAGGGAATDADEDWNEHTEDWTDADPYDDDDPTETQEDDDETHATFQVTYQAARRLSNGSRTSRGASTIVSASKSVKTLPREIELDEDEDDSESHESLEDEAFDGRSFASSNVFGGGGVSDHSGASGGDGLVSPMRPDQQRRSMGPNSKKPARRISIGAGSVASARSTRSGRSTRSSRHRRNSRDPSVTADSSDGGTSGVYRVEKMIVTDPYGEQGTYTGTISNATGMPHGRGRLEYDRAGRWYEGDWKHGRWTGQGHLSNGDGDFYEGGLKNDHKHGYGKMVFADGRTFEGEYVNGQMIEGKMTYQDGSTYEGSWVDGMRHGHGRCVFTDESIYEGEFQEGEFFGHGKMTWSDGGHYVGEWWNGEMHGKGKEIRPDGSLRHDGQWSKGQPIRK